MSLWVGVMSGTSLDGLDVAVLDTSGEAERPDQWSVLASHTETYSPEIRQRLLAAIEAADAESLCRLDFDLGEMIGESVSKVLASIPEGAGDVTAIGSHGQTIWHIPPEGTTRGATLQLGQPSVIAEITSCQVVSDFRTRDMAVGGEGAPLTAYTDWLMFQSDDPRTIQNIGGIANVTFIPGRDSSTQPQAYDTGPGVALIDGAVRELTAGRQTYDEDGSLAARGTVSEEALAEWLADPFFARPPPKSTGRERFSQVRLLRWLQRHEHLPIEDLIATLTEVTAVTIAEGYSWLREPPIATWLCGGGSKNSSLTQRLSTHLNPLPVRNIQDLGIDPEAREAVAFAFLARQHVLGFPANATWATGAAHNRILGSLTPA